MKKLIVLVALLSGCFAYSAPTLQIVTPRPTTHPTTRPAITPATQPIPANTIVWSSELEYGATAWRRTVNKRFGPTALVIMCHGEDFHGEWWMFPDAPRQSASVQSVVAGIRKDQPGRVIVLICCNPGGYALHGLPGVYYARRNVIVPPYEYMDVSSISFWVKATGDISEFVSDE